MGRNQQSRWRLQARSDILSKKGVCLFYITEKNESGKKSKNVSLKNPQDWPWARAHATWTKTAGQVPDNPWR